MSFPALYLACQATQHLPEHDDDEFGLCWSDIGEGPPMDITWAMYRSEGLGLIFGVLRVDAPTLGEMMGR